MTIETKPAVDDKAKHAVPPAAEKEKEEASALDAEQEAAKVWADLLGDDDEGEQESFASAEKDSKLEAKTPESTEEQPASEEAAAGEEEGAAAGEDAPAKTSKPEEEPAPKVEEPPAKTEAQPKAAEPEKPEDIQAKVKQQREEAADFLQKRYAEILSPEDLETLRVEPEKVLPKLLASVYLDAFESSQVAMEKRAPELMRQFQSVQEAQIQAEHSFYNRWPQLADKQHREVVERTIRAYRQANPDASLDSVIEEAGAMAVVTLKLPVEVEKPAARSASPKKAEKPFVPAQGAAGTVAKPKSDNPYTTLYEEMLDDPD